jgi:hypothetical protein
MAEARAKRQGKSTSRLTLGWITIGARLERIRELTSSELKLEVGYGMD